MTTDENAGGKLGKVNEVKNIEQQANHQRRNDDRFTNMFEAENRDSEVVAMYKHLLKFIFLPASITMGIRLNYNWKPQRHIMLHFTLSSLAFAWMCFLYTQYIHVKSGNTMKVLEVFGVYGIGLSVCHYIFRGSVRLRQI